MPEVGTEAWEGLGDRSAGRGLLRGAVGTNCV